MSNGKPIGEIDSSLTMDVPRIVSSRTRVLAGSTTQERKIPAEWAQRQVFEKTDVRIKSLDDAIASRPRPINAGRPRSRPSISCAQFASSNS